MSDITGALIREHQLILRMLDLLERNAPLTAQGRYLNYRFYVDAVDFIRNFADRYHHAKEEDVLFEALIRNGMPRENSPVAAMLIEHEQGRNFVRNMEKGAEEAVAGVAGKNGVIAENALGYLKMLREHIAKEDDILYPLSERLLRGALREAVTAGYERAEATVPAGFAERYEKLVAMYEAEQLADAA